MPRRRRGLRERARELELRTDDDREFESHTVYQCRACPYQSERRFNVRRHERRIHDKTIRRECCGLKITTKGDWYKHCASSHPDKRPTCTLSKPKYEIPTSTKTPNRKITRPNSPGDASDTSQTIDRSLSPPVARRCSARIRQQTLQKIQQQLESSDDDDDASTEELEALDTSHSDDESTISASTEPDYDPNETLDESAEKIPPYLECQFVFSDHLGLDAFIEQLPLNALDEPDQNFLQELENPEDVSGDLLFNQGINCDDDVAGDLQEDHVALQEMTQNVICDDNYVSSVSSISSLLSNAESPRETDDNCNHILQVHNENQLPPKKMILKKFLGCSKMEEEDEDKENAAPGGRDFLGDAGVTDEGQVYFPWNELTQMQRNFLDSIDFEQYKV